MIGACKWTAKLLLTAVVAFAFLRSLVLVLRVQRLFVQSQSQVASTIYIGKPAPALTRDYEVHAFWPEFPRSSPVKIQSAVIKGVRLLTEEWDNNASAVDVLSYYR